MTLRPLLIAFTLATATISHAIPTDTLRTVELMGVEIVTTPKEHGTLRQQTTAATAIDNATLSANQVTSLKHATTLVPKHFLPDYGSRLTSAIYIRGIGSRINTPAVALYVDNIPYTDKSAFDFNLYEVERIDVLRGPQATLYGRNAMGGIVKVHTKNPFRYQGTDVNLSYNTGNNRRAASLTHYHLCSNKLAFSTGGYYEATSGFFRNALTKERVDALQAGGGRARAIYVPSQKLKFDLSSSIDYTDEGGYPYYYTGAVSGEEQYPDAVGKITNNRESSYRRLMVNAGLNVEWTQPLFVMHSTTGYQYLNDRMFLDQDFLYSDIYTLEQRQRSNAFTQELTFRSTRNQRWKWLTGASLIYQSLHTQAPVTFYQDGMQWLESNINNVMPSMDNITMMQMMGFSSMAVNFRDDELRLDGIYSTPTLGTAIYHQSTYNITQKLSATIGLRLDYEHRSMRYDAPANVLYGFTMPNATMQSMTINLQELSSSVSYKGKISDDQWRLLPKFALKYEWDNANNVYASAAMGQRSGGYNLQMFSDLLQGAMRSDMMQGIQTGVGDYMDNLVANNPYIPQAIPDPQNSGTMISLPTFVRRTMSENMPAYDVPQTQQVAYRPEYSWNYEVGAHLTPCHSVQIDAALFYSAIRNQQIARFVSSGLGRMMVNAGRSRSFGAELALRWQPLDALSLTGNYGYTNSKFQDYDDGYGTDYSGNYVPFAPQHTVCLDAAYAFQLNRAWLKTLTIGATYTGTGRIYWQESNDTWQNYYSLLSARLTLGLPCGDITLWGRNLTDTHYNTFCFQSVQRGYEQHGAPAHGGVDFRLRF